MAMQLRKCFYRFFAIFLFLSISISSKGGTDKLWGFKIKLAKGWHESSLGDSIISQGQAASRFLFSKELYPIEENDMQVYRFKKTDNVIYAATWEFNPIRDRHTLSNATNSYNYFAPILDMAKIMGANFQFNYHEDSINSLPFKRSTISVHLKEEDERITIYLNTFEKYCNGRVLRIISFGQDSSRQKQAIKMIKHAVFDHNQELRQGYYFEEKTVETSDFSLSTEPFHYIVSKRKEQEAVLQIFLADVGTFRVFQNLNDIFLKAHAIGKPSEFFLIMAEMLANQIRETDNGITVTSPISFKIPPSKESKQFNTYMTGHTFQDNFDQKNYKCLTFIEGDKDFYLIIADGLYEKKVSIEYRVGHILASFREK